MRLRNKKTGEILGSLGSFILQNPNRINCEAITKYESLSELNSDWEDYEEPKGMQWVDVLGANDGRVVIQYTNEEEAKKAVEKLKAFKRLKGAGFKFNNWIYDYREAENENERGLSIGASYNQLSKIDDDDINLLFGGEENEIA